MENMKCSEGKLPALSNLKFRIASPEQSERLQKVLFELDYEWAGVNPRLIQDTSQPFIFAEEYNGKPQLLYCTGENFFNSCENNIETDTEAFIAQHTVFKVIDEPATPKRNKYSRQIKQDVWVDVYDVLEAFNVTSSPLQHLLKKGLCAGLRGHKDERQDLVDILDSAKRALEMYDNKVSE